MKSIIKKTEKEREKQKTIKEISVKETRYFYWTCDSCNVAFFSDDVILEDSEGIKRCPLSKTTILGNHKPCLTHMYGGDEKCFNEYYKFV